MSCKNGARQVVKSSVALFATVALPMTLSIIMAMADHRYTTAFDATDTIGPAIFADQLEALRIIN